MELEFTETKKFFVTEERQKQITSHYLRKFYNLPEKSFIEDGNLMIYETYATSHSWREKETIRKATEKDLLILEILEDLK